MSRRWLSSAAAVALAAAAVALIGTAIDHEGRKLPLSETGVIREQAAAKHLDPALIAAVIYAESKFDPRPSPAGAQGLMQILPATALYIAHLSGGFRFNTSDLATPSINVAYGSYYLRYLLDHYNGNEMLALAAYNGGVSNVDSWLAHAGVDGRSLTLESIPFGETRAYVERVLAAQRAYRASYPRQLGLA
jgi:soluble lytic murein transglycosylase